MIEILMNALKKDKKDVPKHIAVLALDRTLFKSKMTPDAFFLLRFQNMLQLIEAQIKYVIPKLSFFVSKLDDEQEYKTEFYNVIAKFFSDLAKNEKIAKQCQIRISGNVQLLPEQTRQILETIMKETEMNEKFAVHFFISYDGQDEVLQACKSIVKQANGSAVDMLTKKNIEEQIIQGENQSPELLVVVDSMKELQGFFLWTATQAKIYFSDKNMAEFTQNDLLKAIAHWQKWKKK